MSRLNFAELDRRLIYAFVVLAIALPIMFKLSIPPARMKAADRFYKLVEELPTGGYALVSMDFGPSTKAENEPQAEVVLEHLFRKRIPVVVMTQYALAEAFIGELPERIAAKLSKENPGERWDYGKDWITIGFRPGQALFLQALAKSENIAEFLGKDSGGNVIIENPTFKGIKVLQDIKFVGEFTGLVGMLDGYIQFLQKSGYVPAIGHGCTSITIPEAYIYLDSGQLKGLLEGVAGAAWYSELLRKAHPNRALDSALILNTALGVAHLVMIALIVWGNLAALWYSKKWFSRGRSHG